MYIPYLAYEILNQNQQATSDQKINLKGVMIGNGVMNTTSDWRRQARDTFYSRHQFYGPEIGGPGVGGLMQSCSYNANDKSRPSCIQAQRLADQAVQAVNPYATIGLCYGITSANSINPRTRTSRYPRRRYYYTPWFEQNNPLG